MTPHDWLELVIICFIIGSIVFLIFRGGAANPVGTGGLDRRLNNVSSKLSGVLEQVNEIEERVEKMEVDYAKASDIARLEERLRAHDDKMDKISLAIAAIREDAAERRATADATSRQLAMIYEVIVNKGMNS